MDRIERTPGVLVESSRTDSRDALVALLESHGFEVEACGGPRTLDSPGCPIVAQGRCELLDDADVVVFDLELDDPEDAAVIDSIRGTYPALPVVAEVPTSKAIRHADRLAGCTVFPPHDGERLVHAVEEVLSALPALR